jgi:nucleotide-binding universal stress UspA family protein
MYNHILIPTDGSELAQKAVAHGLQLAKALGARVTIMMSTQMWSPMDMSGQARQGQVHPVEEYENRLSAAAKKVLELGSVAAQEAKVACKTLHVADKDPDVAIVETAKNEGCDLILMSSHGRGAVGRMLLGSVALKVLTYTPVPVQIIR